MTTQIVRARNVEAALAQFQAMHPDACLAHISYDVIKDNPGKDIEVRITSNCTRPCNE